MANNFKFNRKRRLASSYKLKEDVSTSSKLTKILKREVVLTMVSIFGVMVIMLGGSYSIFSQIERSEKSNVLKTGTFSLSFNDTDEGLGNIINLNGEYPTSDEEGERKTPYSFKITNTGTIKASYKIQIVDDSSMIEEDDCIDELLRHEVIKYSIDDSEAEFLSTADGGVIKTGELEGGASATHNIKMWIADNAVNSDLGKHYHGKIVVEAIQGVGTDDSINGLPYVKSVKTIINSNNDEMHSMYVFTHDNGDRDYRYIGRDPYNYVTFNGQDASWRIIGVFEDANAAGVKEKRIKLIKDESIGEEVWDSNNSNNWTTPASLSTKLNIGSFWESLNSKAQGKIENMKWQLGKVDTISNALDIYKKEHNNTTWDGYVGLMYSSDYAYTFANGISDECFNNVATCNLNNATSSWMFNNTNQWTFTASTSNNLVYRINSNGALESNTANVSSSVRPVVYLKSSVSIISGSGKKNDPYILG